MTFSLHNSEKSTTFALGNSMKMKTSNPNMDFLQTLAEYHRLGIADQIDYKKFYLYSIITHSTAIEGSTVTEIENQLLFDEGITAPGRTLQEQMMNLDLKAAYEEAQCLAAQHADYSVELLCRLSALVMKNTGSTYNTPLGAFSAANGDLRLVNVTAGFGGRSYLAYQKVPQALQDFCCWLNNERKNLKTEDILSAYDLSFVAHYRLVSIHPWADGNGRMSRLVMNMLQWEFGLVPVKVLKEQKAEYIQALIDTRNQADETVFPSVMLRLHHQNLQAEIHAFVTSLDGENVTKETANKQTERQRILMRIIKENPQVSIPEMSRKTAVTERTIKRDLQLLQQRGLVERVGGRKEGHWEVIENN